MGLACAAPNELFPEQATNKKIVISNARVAMPQMVFFVLNMRTSFLDKSDMFKK
jgi:hypothetical protein